LYLRADSIPPEDWSGDDGKRRKVFYIACRAVIKESIRMGLIKTIVGGH
jgi:hypothetical protein